MFFFMKFSIFYDLFLLHVSLLEVYKCCVYKVRMHIISFCNLSSIKIQLLMILKKGLLTELEREREKKMIHRKAIIFWGVGPVLGG